MVSATNSFVHDRVEYKLSMYIEKALPTPSISTEVLLQSEVPQPVVKTHLPIIALRRHDASNSGKQLSKQVLEYSTQEEVNASTRALSLRSLPFNFGSSSGAHGRTRFFILSIPVTLRSH
jgi:hypothetical protein